MLPGFQMKMTKTTKQLSNSNAAVKDEGASERLQLPKLDSSIADDGQGISGDLNATEDDSSHR